MGTDGSAVDTVAIVFNDETDKTAEELVTRLVREAGVGPATATLVSACEMALTALLHLESPMYEANVQAASILLATLTGNVLAHRDCAERINGAGAALTRH